MASVLWGMVSDSSDSGGITFTEKNTSFERIQLYELSNISRSDEGKGYILSQHVIDLHSPGHSHMCTPLSGMM